ncbi:MAG: hypothetical protein IT223_09865 [Crocinitomicaceae bacterium]|nr:hypothetical protein [Crocinitomicaceae bacterium]
MKVAFFFFTCCSLLFAFTIDTPSARVDIFQAMENKWITVKAVSKGGNSEDCASIEVKNISGSPLSIVVPSGTLLNSINEDEQDIIVTQPATLFVQNNGTAGKNLYGFCCQASGGLPVSGNPFKTEMCGDELLRKLAEHLAVNSYSPTQQQNAIWAVSDRHSIGGISDEEDKSAQPLREFTANLLHQPVPFYQVDYGYVPNTVFVYAPKTLKGTMDYRITVSGKASLYIYNPEGEKFETFFENRPMQSGFYKQRFSYTATDMTAGTYRVELVVDGKLICENSITL